MADASVSKTDILTGVWVRLPPRAPVDFSFIVGEKLLKAIVVDDEAPARNELKCLLEEAGGVEVVAEASNASEAISSLSDWACDVMFLDINMPDANGLKLAGALRSLSFPPSVVFVSAYSEYAVDAFEVRAVDYLLKPVELDRLKESIKIIEKRNAILANHKKTIKIACEKSGKKIEINAKDIIFARARDDYATIRTKAEKYFAPTSLSAIEKDLEPVGFLRVHRSYLVNMKYAEHVLPAEGGAAFLQLKETDVKVPVSRRKISMIKKMLND